jgi:hypothetical protein
MGNEKCKVQSKEAPAVIFTEPTDFTEAMRLASSRTLLPTDLSSQEIRDRFEPDILRRSVFSARTDSALYLQEVDDELDEYLSGKTNLATVRKNLLQKLDELGYTAEHGFAESAGAVPPADEGGLRDLASRGRLDLMVTTQARQQMNRGYIERWTDPAQRSAFPAWELIRIAPREVPRGLKRTKAGIVPDPGNDWPSRWAKAGGSFYGGRMIALVDDPIWERLGSTELFDDGLDNAYAPFAFNSGFGIRAVSAVEAEQLGVTGSPGKPAGAERAEALPPLPSGLSKDILSKLKAALDRDLKDWDSGALMKRELAAAGGVKNRFFERLIENAFNPAQKRIPKGQPGAGRFASGGPTNPMALGKNVKRARKMLEADLQAHGIDNDHIDPADVSDGLRKKLLVKKPVPLAKNLASLTGGTQAERDQVYAHAQGVFDILPPKVAKKLPPVHILIVDEPSGAYAGYYHSPSGLLVLNKAHGGLDKDTVWHEMGHFIHDEGPVSFRAAVQTHFRSRTFGEALQNNGDYDYKRDSLFSDYMGQIYPHEPPAGSGAEVVSTAFEHLATDRPGFYARASTTNSANYKETMGVALSVLYHGRRR